MTNTSNSEVTVEWQVDAAGNIDLHLNGEPALIFGQHDVRRLPTLKLRRAVVAALNEAQRLGALHGECDRQHEMAESLFGRHVPDHASYGCGLDNTTVTRLMNGEEITVLEGIRPKFVSGDIANALDRAFAVGGRFGHPEVTR